MFLDQSVLPPASGPLHIADPRANNVLCVLHILILKTVIQEKISLDSPDLIRFLCFSVSEHLILLFL